MDRQKINALEAELSALEAKKRFLVSVSEAEKRLLIKNSSFKAQYDVAIERVSVERNIQKVLSELSRLREQEKSDVVRSGPSWQR